MFLSIINVMVGFHFLLTLSFFLMQIFRSKCDRICLPKQIILQSTWAMLLFLETEHFFAKLFVKSSWRLTIKPIWTEVLSEE